MSRSSDRVNDNSGQPDNRPVETTEPSVSELGRHGDRDQRANDNDERNPSRDEVERRAYDLYRERGGDDGRDMDDWLQAERELRGDK